MSTVHDLSNEIAQVVCDKIEKRTRTGKMSGTSVSWWMVNEKLRMETTVQRHSIARAVEKALRRRPMEDGKRMGLTSRI